MTDELKLTPIEKAFWEAAQGRIRDLQPQRWIDRYRVDFCIPSKMLVIELDGHAYHSTKEQRQRDASRQRHLQQLGWTVIRFTGSEIHSSVASCVQQVFSIIVTLSPSSTNPSVPPLLFCTRMQEVVTHLLDKFGLSIEADDVYLRLSNGPGWDPLSIEKHGKTISISHYHEQNGDVVYDPSVEFYIVSNSSGLPEWTPSMLWLWTGPQRCTELRTSGKPVVTKREIHQEAANIAEDWAQQIRAAGWFDAQVERLYQEYQEETPNPSPQADG
jgi:very-short-patch-repair endonuclease